MKAKDLQKSNIHLIWGIALVLMGIAVFIRIPQVMPSLEQMGSFGAFSRFGLYLMGVILVGGGIKKIIVYTKASGTNNEQIADKKEGE